MIEQLSRVKRNKKMARQLTSSIIDAHTYAIAGSKASVINILGPHQIGKSTILREWVDEVYKEADKGKSEKIICDRNPVVSYVNLGWILNNTGRSEDEYGCTFLKELWTAMQVASGTSADIPAVGTTSIRMSKALLSWLKSLPDCHMVIILDQFQDIFESVNDKAIDGRAFLDVLFSVFDDILLEPKAYGDNTCVSYVIADWLPLTERLKQTPEGRDLWSDDLCRNLCREPHIQPVIIPGLFHEDISALLSLYESWVPNQWKTVHRMTGGHPFLVKKVILHAIELSKSGRFALTRNVRARLLNDEECNSFWERYLRSLPVNKDEKKAIRELAKMVDHLGRCIEVHRLGQNKLVRLHLASLKSKGVVCNCSNTSGRSIRNQYQFAIPLMADWALGQPIPYSD